MKISFNRAIGRYIVSELGVIKHTCLSLGDAERLAGFEPDPRIDFTPEDDSEEKDEVEFSDLF